VEGDKGHVIRVAVADDHHLVRQGIRALLEKGDDIEVVGEAANGQEAVELVERCAPDVLVMDIAMPRLNGVQATARVRALDVGTRVVILSMYSDETLVRETLRNGASGYLLKRSLAEELLLAVRAASRGEVYLSPPISQAVVADFLRGAPDSEESRFDCLTPREREVLQLVAEGHTNRAIARMLQVSIKTVEKHRTNLMSKLDVHDVAGLTRIALKHGLVFLDE
jgi:DNA-binding NarL/FixJ family response regulator